MKTKTTFLILLVFSVFLMFGTSCMVIHPQHRSGVVVHSHSRGKVPPGHMKKMTGSKSAKQFAPGQQKKHKK